MHDNERPTFVDHETREKLELNDDEAAIAFFGKRQRLKRIFGKLSMTAFVTAMMVTWVGTIILFAPGLGNGGPLGLVCSFIYSWVGVMSQTLVIAELGSMIPLSGGQYNWVAVLAPKSCSKFLSYLTGWMTVIAWQTGCAAAAYLTGGVIQGLAVLNYDYVPKPWQSLLITYAVLAFAGFINTAMVRALPIAEIMALVLYVLGFFSVLIAMVALTPHYHSNEFVFGTFLQEGGWSSKGLTFLIGTTTILFAFIGNDGATHLAEELEDAPVMIPKTMIISVLINGALGLSILIAILFCLGNLDSTLRTDTGFPFIAVFKNATGSAAGAAGLTIPILLVAIIAVVNIMTTASRMLWAFSRERAVPGHSYISRIHEPTALPLYAIAVTVVANLLITLLSFSYAAFSALTSVSVAGFYSCFLVTALVMFYKRLTVPTNSIRWGPFTLGRAAIPVYLYAIIFTAISFFFSFWPQLYHPTAQTMNYNVVVYFGILILSMVYWLLFARRTYTGPVIEIETLQGGVEEVGEVFDKKD